MDLCQAENRSSLLSKRKKTRRGRKKRCKCRFTFDENPSCSCAARFDIDSETDCQVDIQNQKNNIKRRNMLRPSSSPKAPRNTTEFLMDDHLASRQPNFYNLDNSFNKDSKFSPVSPALRLSEEDSEFDNNCLLDHEEQCVPGMTVVPFTTFRKSKMSPAFSDIDYKYESYEEGFDETFNFQQQDFETAYTSILEETLQKESKSDLIEKIMFTEKKLVALEKTYSKLEDAKSVDIDKLMKELQDLQAENRTLKEENKLLKSLSH